MSGDARPFYSRLLRLNYLRLRGPVAFALFEGSIGVAGLLVLAEIVSSWGLLAIPATVALMVKFNDVVAGSLVRPLAFAHTAPTARGRASSVARGVAVVPSQDEPGQRWPSPGPHVPQLPLGNTDSAEFDRGAVPFRADPTARHSGPQRLP
jgi:hypothetical protein